MSPLSLWRERPRRCYGKLLDAVLHSGFCSLKFAASFLLPPQIIARDHLNKAKNWLKHWDGRADAEKIRLQLDEEALQYIVRALTNLATHDGSQPSEGPRFWAWMGENKSDLLREEQS